MKCIRWHVVDRPPGAGGICTAGNRALLAMAARDQRTGGRSPRPPRILTRTAGVRVLSASLPDLISRRRYRRPWLAGAARCFVGAVQTGRTFCKEDG